MNAEFICIIFLGILYVYQSYRHWKLEKLVFKQLCAVWNFQHMVVDAFDKLAKEIEVERFARSSNNENKKS